tara:strand:- start:3931 stop:4443 length:513 start_codon:yes stop_codon:yes gene_type:complete
MAAYQDIRSYRIGNALVFSGALLGLLLNVFLPTGIGLYQSLAGWGMGLLLLLPLYLLRAMGAGDVKLMAMVGAFLGPQAIMVTLLYVLVTGGVLSICVAIYRGVLKKLFYSTKIIIVEFITNLFTPKSNRLPNGHSFAGITQDATAKMPYGVAIAVGTATFLAVNQLAIL